MEFVIGSGTGPTRAVAPEFSVDGAAADRNLDKASNRTTADSSANRLVVIEPEDNSFTKAAPQLDQQVDRLSELASARQRDLEFNIDEESGKPVIKVVERSTDELVRQIPTEEALAIANKLEQLQGLLIDTHA